MLYHPAFLSAFALTISHLVVGVCPQGPHSGHNAQFSNEDVKAESRPRTPIVVLGSINTIRQDVSEDTHSKLWRRDPDADSPRSKKPKKICEKLKANGNALKTGGNALALKTGENVLKAGGNALKKVHLKVGKLMTEENREYYHINDIKEAVDKTAKASKAAVKKGKESLSRLKTLHPQKLKEKLELSEETRHYFGIDDAADFIEQTAKKTKSLVKKKKKKARRKKRQQKVTPESDSGPQTPKAKLDKEFSRVLENSFHSCESPPKKSSSGSRISDSECAIRKAMDDLGVPPEQQASTERIVSDKGVGEFYTEEQVIEAGAKSDEDTVASSPKNYSPGKGMLGNRFVKAMINLHPLGWLAFPATAQKDVEGVFEEVAKYCHDKMPGGLKTKDEVNKYYLECFINRLGDKDMSNAKVRAARDSIVKYIDSKNSPYNREKVIEIANRCNQKTKHLKGKERTRAAVACFFEKVMLLHPRTKALAGEWAKAGKIHSPKRK